ncbi:hypothetical protein HYDPIDRAFT_186428 [Hydnomerulius pinastri MD-312]|nr:hypothetical protein HYDPIDRAFT_186428 [Hydnomerulius pinastri MD-312]
MANVSQLQPAVIPQVQRSSTEPAEKDADFLALRLLNKRARVRLSPEPIDLSPIPGKACLFAVANSKGWFTAITRDASGGSALILSPLSDLRSAFASASADDDRPYQPQRRLQLGGAIPIIVMFACNDTRIMLGLADGSIIVYASDHLLSSGDGPVNPLHAFPASSSTTLLSVHPNPGDIPELVAVLRDCSNSPGSLTVELLDVQKLMPSGGWMAGKSPSTTPTSLSWSPKGKQLALGLQSGDIVTYSPTATATPKFSIPHPPSASNMSVISIQWLSTSSFHAIYAPPGQLVPDVEQLHFHVSLDAKSNSAQDVKFNSPYLPFPGLRPPGAFVVCLRGWDPSKVLLFIGDSTSSDIGAISSVVDGAGESWHNLSLEETSTPCLPLDKDQNDTIMLGLEVDLTNDSSYRHTTASGEALDLPAPPIMLAYASDGTILGWHLLNVSGKSYPGMVTASDAATSAPSMMSVPSSIVRELSSDMHTTPSASPTTTVAASTSAFGQPSTSPFGPSAFGAQSSAFGQPSAFGQSAFSQQPTSVFGQAPSFGQSSFGQPTTTTTPSPFGQPVTSAFSSAVPSSGGFGAFSSAGPATFGQSAFGAFGGATQSAAPASTPTPPQETSPEDSMAADDGPSLGGFGLGGANSEDADNKPSIFGNTSAQASSSQQSSEGGMIKPASGFGAFANIDQKSPFANPSSAFPATTQPTSVFGQSAFQTKPEGGFGKSTFGTQPSSAFGQSGFSQTTPAFGQSSFGQPAFGQSAFGQAQSGTSTFGKPSFGTAHTTAPATTSSATGGGAFSAFASNTQSAFGALAAKDGGSTKPAWATGDSLKPDQPKSVSGGATTTSVFTKPTESPAVKTPSPFAPRDTDMSTPANATPSAFSSPSPFAATSPFAARESGVRGDDSRSPSPAPTQQEPAAPSTPFKSSSPGPTTGAFSNLKTTPSNFFKPASGFFGEMPKDSPFFAPKPPEATPVSAFALAAAPVTPTSTPPKPSTTAPTFGASSMPGGTLKSPFTAELESLKQLATAASAKSADIKKTSGVTHTKADLGDVRKWLFGDIKEYGRILADVQVDVTELKLQRITLRKSLREIDSNMLKAETRKEEIKRFNKAKTDAEFAKMLKVRTLGPEYLETQQQLRRDIRAMRDRVQKLEDHLQASKKKISELRTGKPSLRAPSLDTVSRTFRNIDIAIDQQKQDVSKLRFRMSKLDISSEGASARDKLIGSTSKRPLNVTPNVAVTTAAALNAERSAQRLKRALLAARTQPLLNTKAAAAAAPPPTSFQTPQKAVRVKTEAITPNAPFSLPTTPMMSFPTSIPAWTPPTPTPSEFGDSASHGISPSRNRGGHRHPHPIVSKKIASPGSATQGSPFEWKPVEPMKPISSLPFAIRPAGSNYAWSDARLLRPVCKSKMVEDDPMGCNHLVMK